MGTVRIDHSVIAVSDWASNRFYRDIVGAEVVETAQGRFAYRIGDTQLNVHGPGVEAGSNVARLPVRPGKGQGTSVYIRDPDGILLEFMSYGDA
jgi:catechol 2,3-dioxygenase-like lactoylglutathione lyase family enzyme